MFADLCAFCLVQAREVQPDLSKQTASILVPDLQLTKGAVVRSTSAASQIRILKALYEEGVVDSEVYSSKASDIMSLTEAVA